MQGVTEQDKTTLPQPSSLLFPGLVGLSCWLTRGTLETSSQHKILVLGEAGSGEKRSCARLGCCAHALGGLEDLITVCLSSSSPRPAFPAFSPSPLCGRRLLVAPAASPSLSLSLCTLTVLRPASSSLAQPHRNLLPIPPPSPLYSLGSERPGGTPASLKMGSLEPSLICPVLRTSAGHCPSVV